MGVDPLHLFFNNSIIVIFSKLNTHYDIAEINTAKVGVKDQSINQSRQSIIYKPLHIMLESLNSEISIYKHIGRNIVLY